MELWEAINGLMALLGAYLLIWCAVYLINIRREYWGNWKWKPWHILVISMTLIVLGHTLKDGIAWWARAVMGEAPPANLPPILAYLAAAVIIGGKLGCTWFFTRSRGNWPWVFALILAGIFLLANRVW